MNYYPKGKVTNLYKRLADSDADTHGIKFSSSVKSGIKPFKVFKNQLLISKFRSDTPCENITGVAKYFADMVISNGYHEDFNLGVDKEMFKWLSENPESFGTRGLFVIGCHILRSLHSGTPILPPSSLICSATSESTNMGHS